MNFAQYLHDNRDRFIDRRPPDEITTTSHYEHAFDAGVDVLEPPPQARSSGHRVRTMLRDGLQKLATIGDGTTDEQRASERQSFREVKPFFARSPYATPLPYLEPWDRR